MYLPKIFSFSGRKQSGKTELTKVCKNYGYEIINFADPMKNMICSLLNITRYELDEKKDIKCSSKIIFGEKELKFLMEQTGINYDILKTKTEFDSIREILQVMGTDIIRKYNPEWHINKIKEILENPENKNKKFCFGDTRFKNEKLFLESLGAECWFIIRPNNFNISNHVSEIELTWCNFNRNILINEIFDNFVYKWEKYIELHFEENIELKKEVLNERNFKILRNKLIYLLNNNEIKKIVKETNIRKTQIIWLCKKLLIYEFKDTEYIFKNKTIQNVYLFGQLETSGYIKNYDLVFEHKNRKIVNNYKKSLNIKSKIKKNKKNKVFYIKSKCPIIIENLKKWNFENIVRTN